MARKAMKENDGKYATMCCCCVCVCEDEATDGEKCCFCFPIKCGVQAIAAFIFIVGIIQFWEIFYQLLNDKIDWWYVLVGIAITVPLLVGWGLTIYWLAEDTDSTRVALMSASILLIISVALLATWNAVYFNFLYSDENVATGNDGIGYITVTVKQQVVFGLYFAVIICCLFAYFIIVTNHYKELYRVKQLNDWLEAHGPNAGLGWSHEDETWPPLSAKQQKKKDEEEEDKKMLKQYRKDKKKKEREAEEAKKNEGAAEAEEAKEGAE